MDILILIKAFILGVVEGATEFLPISSTGHLIIVGDLLQFNSERDKVFKIVIQLGAILAICWEYRARLGHVVANVGEPASKRLFVNIALAFLPAAILGVLFHDIIKTYLFTPLTVSMALILGGFAILLIEKYKPEFDTATVDDMDWKHALKIGLAQSMALFPGVSRAGATILGGVVFGLSRKAAAEFSFFLAIPIMFAATGYDLFKNWELLHANDIPVFAVGFITAFFSALLMVRGLLKYVSNHDFRIFAWYRIVFGLIVLAYFSSK
ncbi:undecaprenyl-diphosphatase [Methylobacillus sp. MM3]|uniref:undecaprenyl-diphosphate phosphatase n=1 Tax=Methylobacillus sp. MM3 TaxID=1848039 RepID=UPI0007E126B8|nr:undecaprenyl-diphosphate phosphatase [Methylobacillus sp. MM3]OAJ69985.1 undecaprenyl-diphosphatase [Methylobacillus sp. MM3]